MITIAHSLDPFRSELDTGRRSLSASPAAIVNLFPCQRDIDAVEDPAPSARVRFHQRCDEFRLCAGSAPI